MLFLVIFRFSISFYYILKGDRATGYGVTLLSCLFAKSICNTIIQEAAACAELPLCAEDIDEED